ncbi:MAG: hypothetical protein JOZ24_11075 [Candidatus Eremiobacteraeota bacterium]|nr:hypothetical protein [Candidatus Eremiobacteraeota bacterium]
MLTLRARGQTLPLWAGAIAVGLILAFAALQYGQILMWQIRAQTAADAVAAAALSVQTTSWNQQNSLLYATAVEEYRMRNLLEGMVAAGASDSGCGGAVGCAATYLSLRTAYLKAVARYTTDVQLLNRVASRATLASAESDARALVAKLSSDCATAATVDCAFAYSVTSVQKRSGSVKDVEQDGGAWEINTGSPANVKDDYMPAQVEVVACARVAPIVPAIPGFHPPTFTAIGRAAATSAMVTQEWIQPGQITNPATGLPFQPLETYGSGTSSSGPGHNWFTVDYGGNSATAYPAYDAYSETVNNVEFSAAFGWWATIPIRVFSGALNAASYSCAG